LDEIIAKEDAPPPSIFKDLPHEIIMSIIKDADGGKHIHGVKLNNCLKQMKKVFTVTLECEETGETKEGWVSNCFNPLIEGEKRFEYPNLYTPFTNTALQNRIKEDVMDCSEHWYEIDRADDRRVEVWRPPEVDELNDNDDWFGSRTFPEIFEC